MRDYSMATRSREVIDGLKVKLRRKDERIAELERLLDERTDERDRARGTAVELEQQLAAAANAIETQFQNIADEMRAIDDRAEQRLRIDPIWLERAQVELAVARRFRDAFLDLTGGKNPEGEM